MDINSDQWIEIKLIRSDIRMRCTRDKGTKLVESYIDTLSISIGAVSMVELD